MKKFYFLTLALILGAMTMSAKTVYLNTGGSSLWNQSGAYFEAWAWVGDADGSWYDMTLVEGDIFKADIPDENNKIIFVRKDPNSAKNTWEAGVWNQTSDLDISADKNMYTKTGWGNGEGKWENYETYVPEEAVSLTFTVTVPEGTENCYIVGSFNNWNNFVQMTKISDTRYTITLDNIVKSTCQYKYTCGESWDYVEKQSDGVTEVTNRTWAENDVVATWNAMPTPTAIEEVGVDAGAAVYYNLQGVKVANPENGIFIKKQGNRTSKVVL